MCCSEHGDGDIFLFPLVKYQGKKNGTDHVVVLFSFLRNLHSVSYSSCPSLHSHQQNVSVHFYKKILKSLSCIQLFATPWPVAYQASLSMDSPGKNIGVGCRVLLQGIFPTQGLNPGILHCRQMFYPLSHQGLNIFKKHLSPLFLIATILTGMWWYLTEVLNCISSIISTIKCFFMSLLVICVSSLKDIYQILI